MIHVLKDTGNKIKRMKKAKQIGIVVIHDEFNSLEFLIEVFSQVFGYEISQAANCAHIVTEKGSYIVKTFKKSELDKAAAYRDILSENQVPVKIIPL